MRVLFHKKNHAKELACVCDACTLSWVILDYTLRMHVYLHAFMYDRTKEGNPKQSVFFFKKEFRIANCYSVLKGFCKSCLTHTDHRNGIGLIPGSYPSVHVTHTDKAWQLKTQNFHQIKATYQNLNNLSSVNSERLWASL